MHTHSQWGPFFASYLVLLFGLALLGLFVYISIRRSQNWKQLLLTWAGLLVAAIVVLYFASPQDFNLIFYQGVYAHIAQALFIVIGAVFGCFSLKYSGLLSQSRRVEAKLPLVITHGVAAVIFFLGGFVLVAELNKLKTYELHKFDEISELFAIEPEQVLWTPPQVAHAEIEDTFQSSQYMVALDYIEGIPFNGGVGYAVPTSPDGLWNAYMLKGDGYVIFDDNYDVSPENRIERQRDEQPIGVDMEWTDNIWYQLYRHDMTAYYPDYYFLQLDKENPNKLTAVAPKIEYRYHFKYLIPVAVPEWAGLTLLQKDEDGSWSFEDVTVEQAKTEERFQRQPVFPKTLARIYTEVQIYDQGLWGAWVNREGKIQIPELPGHQQYPHFVPQSKNTSFYQTVAEPSGSSGGMFRVYYLNTHTGERFVHEFAEDEELIGPVSGIDRVKSIRGYIWKETSGESESGSMVIAKPVLLTREGRTYWKYTITHSSFRGIAATAVLDAKTRKVEHVFPDRDTFSRWYAGEDVDTSVEGLAQEQIAKLRRLFNEQKEVLEILEQKLSPTPDQ